MKKLMVAVVMVVMSVLMFTGCGQSEQQQVEGQSLSDYGIGSYVYHAEKNDINIDLDCDTVVCDMEFATMYNIPNSGSMSFAIMEGCETSGNADMDYMCSIIDTINGNNDVSETQEMYACTNMSFTFTNFVEEETGIYNFDLVDENNEAVSAILTVYEDAAKIEAGDLTINFELTNSTVLGY